jgi:hypothetical protein
METQLVVGSWNSLRSLNWEGVAQSTKEMLSANYKMIFTFTQLKCEREALRMSRAHPSPDEQVTERSSMTSRPREFDEYNITRHRPHAQDTWLQVIIVLSRPTSVLPDVLAIHTIEMIPKSMILILWQIQQII